MKVLYQKAFKLLSGVCSYVGGDLLLGYLDNVVDMMLDDITRQVIRKYQANLRRAFQEEGSTPNHNFQMKMVGIKLFILYQKGKKLAKRITDQLVGEGRLFLTTLDDSMQGFKQNFVVKKGLMIIEVGSMVCGEVISGLRKQLEGVAERVKYNVRTQAFIVYAKDLQDLTYKIMATVWEFVCSAAKLKRSRALYNRMMARYRSIKSHYHQIKQESERLSHRLFSEGENELEMVDLRVKSRKEVAGIVPNNRFFRNMKSQDNLYQLRKYSSNGGGRQIVEEEQDRSEYLEASRMEQSEEDFNLGQGAVRSRLGSRQLMEPGCLSSGKSSLHQIVNSLNQPSSNSGHLQSRQSAAAQIVQLSSNQASFS